MIDKLKIEIKKIDKSTLSKGLSINNKEHIICNNTSKNSYLCFVPSSQENKKHYTISIELINNVLQCTCTCLAYQNFNKYCKHIAAVFLRMISNPENILNSTNGLFDEDEFAPKNDVRLKIIPNKVIPKLPTSLLEINENLWENYTNEIISRKEIQQSSYNNSYYFNKLNFNEFTFHFKEQNINKNTETSIRNYIENKLEYNCNCSTYKSQKICKHIVASLKILGKDLRSLLKLLVEMPITIKKIAEKYGVTEQFVLSDFNIENNYYNFSIEPKEKGLLPVTNINKYKPSTALNLINKNFNIEKTTTKYTLRALWTFNTYQFPYFKIEPILTTSNKNGTISKKFIFLNESDFNFYDFNKFKLSENDLSIISLINNNNSSYSDDELSIETYRQNLYNLFPKLNNYSNLFIDRKSFLFNENNILNIQSTYIDIILKVEICNDNYFTIYPIYSLNGKIINVEFNNTFLVIYNANVYLIKPMVIHYIKAFAKNNSLKWHINNWENIKNNFLIPASEYITLQVDEKLNYIKPKILNEEKIIPKVYLSESENHLVITPTFCYINNTIEKEIGYDLGVNLQVTCQEELFEFIRNQEFEVEHYNYIKQLHPTFENQNDTYFILPNTEVLKNNWLLGFYEKLKNDDIEILGSKLLSKFNYNPNKPKIKFTAGSGTDWFDIKIDVKFGNQTLSINDLKTSILNKQQYVNLDDGSIGILPEEWFTKYEGLFRSGKLNKKGSVEINAFQSSVIDSLTDEIDNNKNIKKFQDKILALKTAKDFIKEKTPKNFNTNLRDYQLQGYNWLNSLQSIGWGGCLADDMGLGKTIQMLAFIQNQVNKNKNFSALLILPTSLVFNWENEINKFTPTLSYYSYVGSNRNNEQLNLLKKNITLTTYGIVRIDLEILKKFEFDIIVLDESQAIKNNQSQIAKAVKLLNSKNKFVMTGTPIENSTLDLYSQFDFVNSGMLGSDEQFKNNYANAIDKNKDEIAANQLRNIIQPFLLNRKKHQVAKDLPTKTETILYCEMAPDQRRVYEYYKEKIRTDLINKIDTIGLAKSGMHVLQGLLKLRQICNDTKLLPDADYSKISSIKTDVLLDNIEELILENHKVLVFSFFSSMLDILEEKFNKRKIKHVKITGEVKNRQELVDQFQTDINTKVFLISLKSGGFGLNLTEADYVFMFDPWWNPAAEQQAIDRTHRIGQTKKVFAYKLICKGTIEEKILELQIKKKSVSDDIINLDNAILKQLKKEDIINLFS